MLFKKKGEDYITAGDSTKMKIRNGYNNKEDKFYIQIQEIKTQKSLRIYMNEEYFKTFAKSMLKTQQFTEEDQKDLISGSSI